MMTAVLKPGIYRIIVDSAVQSATATDDEERGRLARQRCLINLMKVSTALYSICGPQLYRDCTVSDLTAFLEIRGNNKKGLFFDYLEILRLKGPDTPYQTSYKSLMVESVAWTATGKMRIGDAQSVHEENIEKMTRSAELAASRFQRALQVGFQVFPKLKSVVMADRDLGLLRHLELQKPEDSDAEYDESAGLFSFLPLTLINQPSVDHYCQSQFGGPFELPNRVVKPTKPLKTVTFHPSDTKTMWNTRYQLPIIIGATNRYIVPRCQRVLLPQNCVVQDDANFDTLFSPLMWLLSRDYFYIQEGDVVRAVPAKDIPLDATHIEIYHYVRLELLGADGNVAGLGSLEMMQDLLDTRLKRWGWRGSVILVALETCPPCAACGKVFGE